MREMQTGGIKRRRTKGGNRSAKEEGADEIIKQDEGIYCVGSMHKSVRKQTLTHISHAQIDLFSCQHQEIELLRQMLT